MSGLKGAGRSEFGIPVVVDESVDPDRLVLRADGQPDTVVRLPPEDRSSSSGPEGGPDILEVIVGQVQFAVRQIDAALECNTPAVRR